MTDEKDPAQPSDVEAAGAGPAPSPLLDGQVEKKPPGVEHDKPPPDEFFGRGFKKKKAPKGEKAKRPPKTQVEEQIDAAMASSAIQGKKAKEKKKKFRMVMIIGVVCLFGWAIKWLLAPYEGGMAYGICKVFLENTVRYPHFLRISMVEEFETSVRIWYTQVDSFGEYRMEPIQCYYKQDPERGTIVDKILINRREVDRKVVEDFNRVLPVVIAYPPDLVIPYPLPDSLQDLQIETNKFRKPIL